MKSALQRGLRFLFKNEQGQDLAEYCLITALVALFACAIFYKVSGGVQDLWTTANTTLASSPQPVAASAELSQTPTH